MLGFTFEYHKHGNSPYHYSTTIDQTVLEIYPLKKSQLEADENLRLGFEIDDFENTLQKLKEHDITFNEPILTDFGFLTIITDPDNRKIELYKKWNKTPPPILNITKFDFYNKNLLIFNKNG